MTSLYRVSWKRPKVMMYIVSKILLCISCKTFSNPVHENSEIVYNNVHNYKLEVI